MWYFGNRISIDMRLSLPFVAHYASLTIFWHEMNIIVRVFGWLVWNTSDFREDSVLTFGCLHFISANDTMAVCKSYSIHWSWNYQTSHFFFKATSIIILPLINSSISILLLRTLVLQHCYQNETQGEAVLSVVHLFHAVDELKIILFWCKSSNCFTIDRIPKFLWFLRPLSKSSEELTFCCLHFSRTNEMIASRLFHSIRLQWNFQSFTSLQRQHITTSQQSYKS